MSKRKVKVNPVTNLHLPCSLNISNGVKFRKNEFIDEDIAWLRLTPSQRLYQTSKLWQFYIALGGKLDPEPNPQSPFYFQET